MFQRLKSEFRFLKGALGTLKMTTPIAKNPNRVFPWVVEELAEKFGPSEALVSDRERFTYAELDARANRYARWALAQGLKKGDVVCLMMLSRPEYIAIWLGITRIGGVVGLLNTNLTGTALAHSVSIVQPKHVIVVNELLPAFRTSETNLTVKPKVWVHGADVAGHDRIDTVVSGLDGGALPAEQRPALSINDHALFIYTSGTTGLPKAANINHYRLMLAAHGFAGAMGTKSTDRMYDCLPMYHSNGGIVATGAMLIAGGTVVIRERFSAREFWDDVVRWNCTMFFYIGELCRYLVTAPPSEAEKRHKIRLCCGNGMRPDVWGPFQARYHIPQIIEFYAATEGNVAVFNFDSKPGAVGRLPWYLAHRFPIAIVKFDIEREEPVRGPDGFCIRCKPGEVGEVIGRILNDPSKPSARFEGYADKSATEKKILRDVFEKGDAYFRTGDLMKQDEDGYFYFIDRIGDTYRWKGENVATSEVSEAITVFPGVTEANVYGVQVQGRDGRAGMAEIVSKDKLDLKNLGQHLEKSLPVYARPLFLRLTGNIEVTGTFKQKKIDLVKEGFDPAVIKDDLFFFDSEKGAFVQLDKPLYERIQSGGVRL
jgi:fatty-acyl-CoA synthase